MFWNMILTSVMAAIRPIGEAAIRNVLSSFLDKIGKQANLPTGVQALQMGVTGLTLQSAISETVQHAALFDGSNLPGFWRLLIGQIVATMRPAAEEVARKIIQEFLDAISQAAGVPAGAPAGVQFLQTGTTSAVVNGAMDSTVEKMLRHPELTQAA